MKEFRFHITLTGPRPKSDLPALHATLSAHLSPLLPRPFPVDALSLMGEDRQDRFHLLHRHTLTA